MAFSCLKVRGLGSWYIAASTSRDFIMLEVAADWYDQVILIQPSIAGTNVH